MANNTNSITIEHVDAAYGAVRVLEDVSLRVASGETVVLLGTNGNGKSTLMKCVMGMVRPREGRILAEIDGQAHDLVGMATEDIVDLGIALVPEGRRLFPAKPWKRTCFWGRAAAARARRSRPTATSALKSSRGWPSAKTSWPVR